MGRAGRRRLLEHTPEARVLLEIVVRVHAVEPGQSEVRWSWDDDRIGASGWTFQEVWWVAEREVRRARDPFT